MSNSSALDSVIRAQNGVKWARVVLKLSGEAFGGGQYGIAGHVVKQLAEDIIMARRMGVDVAVVIGGGNIWRGKFGEGQGLTDRAQADYMGMLATVINALALQDMLEQLNQEARVMTALHIDNVAEPYIRRRALRHLEKGRVVILAGGLGAPFFTTDTPAALRAAELSANAVIKGTHSGVKGVYTADPKLDSSAVLLEETTYMDVLNNSWDVMDPTSITFCMDNSIPIVVFDAMEAGNLAKVLQGVRGAGTLVQS